MPLERLMLDVRAHVLDENSQFLIEKFEAGIKTGLLHDSEHVVMSLQIKGFFGAITKRIFDCMHVDPTRKLYFVPEELKETFSADSEGPYGMEYGLNPKLLALPHYTSLADMKHNLRRSPHHVQQLQGQMRNVVQSPNAYYHYTGQALRLLLMSSAGEDPAEAQNFDFGLFEEPDYKQIALLSLVEKEELLASLACIVWDMYDAEWWLMSTEYSKMSVEHRSFATTRPFNRTITTFPRTVDSFDAWEDGYGARSVFHYSRSFNQNVAEIVTNGKYHVTICFEFSHSKNRF
jgi:hypothetical protein